MKYFKDEINGCVFAFESDGSQDEFIPENLVEMTPEEIKSHVNPKATKEDVDLARLQGYSNPVTGSDRLFSEAIRMQLMGEPGHEDVRERAIERFKEIQAENPWPEE